MQLLRTLPLFFLVFRSKHLINRIAKNLFNLQQNHLGQLVYLEIGFK